MNFGECRAPGCTGFSETKVHGYYLCSYHASQLNQELEAAFSNWYYKEQAAMLSKAERERKPHDICMDPQECTCGCGTCDMAKSLGGVISQ